MLFLLSIEMGGWARPLNEAEATLILLCFGLRVATTRVVNIFEIGASCGKSHIICFFNYT